MKITLTNIESYTDFIRFVEYYSIGKWKFKHSTQKTWHLHRKYIAQLHAHYAIVCLEFWDHVSNMHGETVEWKFKIPLSFNRSGLAN